MIKGIKAIPALVVALALGIGVAAAASRTNAATCIPHTGQHCKRDTQTTTTSTTTGATTTTGSTPTGSLSAATPCGISSNASYRHVVVIVMENHDYSRLIGASDAPYLNWLAAHCGLATNYTAAGHPSLPNYLALTAGTTFGISDDKGPNAHPLGSASIFSQLGSNWRSLEESMPGNCYPSDSGTYVVHHNPAAYYTGVASACKTLDVPLGQTPDLSAAYTFITPNECDDMHDCSVASGDAWLKAFIPKLIGTSQYQAGNTVVFLTWDEGSSTDNQVVTEVIAPTVKPGLKVGTKFTHYSLLRTAEEILGLPLLGNAGSAASMRSAFGL